MEYNGCSVTFYNLSRSDANRLVRAAAEICGGYWGRRVHINPPSLDWFVEVRPNPTSNEWTAVFGPWEEHNAQQFAHMWNAKAGFERYRARPHMTLKENG